MKDKLKARRKEMRLTQEDLADKIGVSKQYIGLIERGKVSPGLDVIEKIAEALNCELRLLLK